MTRFETFGIWLGVTTLLFCACSLYVEAQNTRVLLNTQFNAEGTGNVLTVTEQHQYWLGICVAGPGAYEDGGWSFSAADVPDFWCHNGSNVTYGTAKFNDGASTKYLYNKLLLPSDWTGAIDARFIWQTSGTSGNMVWQIQTACSATTETTDPAWNTASTVTTAAQGTANRQNTSSLTGVTTTGCTAGEMMWFRVLRDPTTGADTLAADAELITLELTYRRAI